MRLDADVLSIEASRSDMEVLDAFAAGFDYPNEIGPGVYDIHSPRIPSTEEIERLLELAERRDRARAPVGQPGLRPEDARLGRGPPGADEPGRGGAAAAGGACERVNLPPWATTGVGSLPFTDVEAAVDHVLAAYDVPFCPQLPRLEGDMITEWLGADPRPLRVVPGPRPRAPARLGHAAPAAG